MRALRCIRPSPRAGSLLRKVSALTALTASGALLACSHDETASTATADAASSATKPVQTAQTALGAPSSSTGAETPAASASAPAGGATTTGQARTLNGKYTAVKSAIYGADAGAWAHMTWGADESGGLGQGTVTLAIAADGRVTGALAGALGNGQINGMDRDGHLSASVTPAPGAANGGFTGLLTGSDDGKVVTATMHLSDGTNLVVRDAVLTFGS